MKYQNLKMESCELVQAFCNGLGIAEGRGLRSTKFNTKTMFNRSENVHITTKAPSFGYVLL